MEGSGIKSFTLSLTLTTFPIPTYHTKIPILTLLTLGRLFISPYWTNYFKQQISVDGLKLEESLPRNWQRAQP